MILLVRIAGLLLAFSYGNYNLHFVYPEVLRFLTLPGSFPLSPKCCSYISRPLTTLCFSLEYPPRPPRFVQFSTSSVTSSLETPWPLSDHSLRVGLREMPVLYPTAYSGSPFHPRDS